MANPDHGEFKVSVQNEERAMSSYIMEELSSGVANGSVVLLDARERKVLDTRPSLVGANS